jgi:hypothetical protein
LIAFSAENRCLPFQAGGFCNLRHAASARHDAKSVANKIRITGFKRRRNVRNLRAV